MTTIQMLWTNSSNLGVPGSNLTSTKLLKQCYPPRISCRALLFGKTLPGDFLNLGIQVPSFRPPVRAFFFFFLAFLPHAPCWESLSWCHSIKWRRWPAIPGLCQVHYVTAESAVHDGGGCQSPRIKPNKPGIYPLTGKALFGAVHLADFIFLRLKTCP